MLRTRPGRTSKHRLCAVSRLCVTLPEATRGLWQAIEDGHVTGPRFFYGGRAFSQTGGHGDVRPAHLEPCACVSQGNLAQVVDGADALRKSIREELRQGAHHIKLFVSGGIASPTDPIWMIQYSEDEMRAAVDEAASRRAYVAVHAYSPQAIERALLAGCRSIEHGNLITPEVADLAAEKGAFVVPTLAAYDSLFRFGEESGAPATMLEKLRDVRIQALDAIAICRTAGVKIGLGTDLLGRLHKHQLDEFSLRSSIETPIDILRSATSVNAELLMQEGQLGCVAVGAMADLLVVDGDPLSDVSLLAETNRIVLVMKGGEIIRTSLGKL